MKVITVLMAMAVSALAAPSDPGTTALSFLERVRAKNVNLAPGADTALSPHTSETKRQQIARQLERLASDLGNDALEVGPVKLDGDLAAVLVRKHGDLQPTQSQVFAVALVKRDTGWTAAPVPASFENTGVGFTAPLRQRLAALEDWMLRERANDLENLHAQSQSRLQRQIEEALPAATLRKLNSQEVAKLFLSACAQHNLPVLLGLLGGLSADQPEDWPQRLAAANAAVGSSSAELVWPWRLLMAPEVLRVALDHQEDPTGARLALACLDPAGARGGRSKTPKIEMLGLNLAKTRDGFWQINPQPAFFQDNPTTEHGALDEDLGVELLEQFPTQLALEYPPTPQPTAALSKAALLAALKAPQPTAWLRLMRLNGDPADVRHRCVRAVQFWWSVRNPTANRTAVLLAQQDQADLAVVTCQLFDAHQPDRLDLQWLFFEQTPDGWLWNPLPSDTMRSASAAWIDAQTVYWKEHWHEALLVDCFRLDALPAAAPTEAEARQVVAAWLQATRAGDVPAALRLCTRLNTPDSNTTLLRNLGYEMTGLRPNQPTPTITGSRRGRTWTVVGTKSADPKPTFPLYPVLATPAGPRILLEIQLLSSTNRSRDFLNKQAFERLMPINPAAAAELKSLFSQHQTDFASQLQP